MTLDNEPLRRALAMAHAIRQVLKDVREDDPGDDEARVGPLLDKAASLADELVKVLRRLAPVIVAGTMVMQSPAPPLAPAEAVRVLRASHSLADRTDARSYPEPPPSIVIRSSASDGPFGAFPKFPPSKPLNCCSIYVTRLPRDPWARH